MKAYLINMHLLLPRSRTSANIKVKYKGYISKKMAVSGAFAFHKHILLCFVSQIPDYQGKEWIGRRQMAVDIPELSVWSFEAFEDGKKITLVCNKAMISY